MTAVLPREGQESSFDGYQFRLPMYEGPLDILLRLIERHQLQITDVSLVEVTDQFLAYVASLPATDPTVLADFAAIASRLLLLKSRSLLPSIEEHPEESETDDLRQQLIAYRAVRDSATLLANRQREGLSAFRRPPTPGRWGATRESIRQMPVQLLLRALQRCHSRKPPSPRSFTPRPIISLAEMTRRFISHLRAARRTRFSSILSGNADRHEYVAGFVTLLSLWRQRAVDVWQEEHFSEIEVVSLRSEQQVADD